MEKMLKQPIIMNKRNRSLLFNIVRSTVVALLLAMALMVSPMIPAQIAYAQGEIELTENFTLTSDMIFLGTGFIIGANNITVNLNGHTITGRYPPANPDKTVPAEWGVQIVGHSGVTVKNGTIRGFSFGVGLTGSNQNTIQNITVTSNTGNGISLWNDSNNNVVKDCTITNNGPGALPFVGIMVSNSSDNNTIKNTIITNNSLAGISVAGSDGNSIMGNTVTGHSSSGISLHAAGAPLPPVASHNNMVKGNTCANNLNGITVRESSGNSLLDNTLTENTQNGIVLTEGADNNTVNKNHSNSNGRNGIAISNSDGNSINNNAVNGNDGNGIAIVSGADNNKVQGNDITNNMSNGIYVGWPPFIPPDEPIPPVNNSIIKNSLSGNTYPDIYDITT